MDIGICNLNFTFKIYNFFVCNHIGKQIFLYMWTVPYTSVARHSRRWVEESFMTPAMFFYRLVPSLCFPGARASQAC